MSRSDFLATHGYYLEELDVGMNAVASKTFTATDIATYAAVSGDTNPLHLDEAFATQTRFGTRIVHGMLTVSLWSALLGTRLPGPGSIYMGQDIKFVKPVHIGDTVTARVTVAEIDDTRQRVYLDTDCRVGDTQVAAGRAVVWVPRRAGDR